MLDEPQAYKYFAFISYSRKDSKVAAWLQKRLEWFRFPVKLVPEDRRPPKPPYVRPIYRDKTNLEVTDEHYWQNIRRALEESCFLIILCSPHSAKSEPVNMEVGHFLKTHNGDAGMMVPVIVSGNVTSTGEDAALCPALRALGDTLINRNLPNMVPDAFTAEQDAWEAGFVSLVSYLLRLERTALGDHIRREERRQLARNRTLTAVFALLTLAAIAGGIVAWLQRSEALEAKREVEKANTIIVEKNAINLKNLHEASMADYSVAVQRIENENKWHEGVAHLARSLKWEPANSLAAIRLYSTLAFYAAEKQTWARKILRHEHSVYSAQFSADSTRILTTGGDTARVWDAASGQPLGEPMLYHGHVRSAQLSPDGTCFVTASDYILYKKGEARVWDAASGNLLGEPMRHDAVVYSAQFSADGTRILTASADKTARVWDAATSQPLGEPMRHDAYVRSAQFSADGTRILTASDDKTARVWDAASGQPLGEPMRHDAIVRSAQFSADGTSILTTSEDKTARVWDAASGQPLGEPMRHDAHVRSAQFSPDGTRIVTASDYILYEKGEVRLWDAASGNFLGAPMRHDAVVYSAQFSADGTRIVTASDDHTARVWDAATSQPLGEPLRHEDSVYSAQFSADGTRILTASDDKTARVWDAATGQPLGEPLFRHVGYMGIAQFSADGTRILTTGSDTARVWDAASGQPLGEPMRHEDSVVTAQFSPDGTRIVTAGDDYTARVWDAATGQPLGEQMRHEDSVVTAQFSADGTRILTTGGDTARVWDAASTQPVGEPMRHEGVNSAQYSPDGTRILTAGDDYTARVWDSASGQPLGEPLRHDDWIVISAQFNPDGTRILTTSGDYTARLWDAASGQPLGKPLGEPLVQEDRSEGQQSVLSAQFSTDGTLIITPSWDHTARVWDAASGQPIGEPMRHEDSVVTAQFSPDGTRIITASYDDTAVYVDGTSIVTGRRDTVIRVWDAEKLTRPPIPVPDWMLTRAHSIGGLEFTGDGGMHPISPEARRKTVLAPPPGNDNWSKLARWLAQPADERTLTPDSHFNLRKMAEKERDTGTEEGLESALHYDPTVPLARLMLADLLVKKEDGKKPGERDPSISARVKFLREYEVKLLPPDLSICKRAADLLRAQGQDELARQALAQARGN